MEEPIYSKCYFMFNCGAAFVQNVYYNKNNKCNSFEHCTLWDSKTIEYSQYLKSKN